MYGVTPKGQEKFSKSTDKNGEGTGGNASSNGKSHKPCRWCGKPNRFERRCWCKQNGYPQKVQNNTTSSSATSSTTSKGKDGKSKKGYGKGAKKGVNEVAREDAAGVEGPASSASGSGN